MKTIKRLLALLIAISTISCNSTSESTQFYANAIVPAADASSVMESANFSPPALASAEYSGEGGNTSSEPIPVSTTPSDKKKIIKNGRIDIRSKDVAASKKSMDLLLKKFSAYYDQEEYRNNDQAASYTLKLRVPSAHFENMLAAIESGEDEITGKNINTTDVTEEYVDTQTRLANKREYLKRYKDILLRAGSIKDVLEVEENIRVLMEEIESAEGRLKYLADQVAYSTLDVNLVQYKEFVYKAAEQPRFVERIKKSLGRGWDTTVDVVIDLVSLWPLWLLVTGIALFIRRLIKRRRDRLGK